MPSRTSASNGHARKAKKATTKKAASPRRTSSARTATDSKSARELALQGAEKRAGNTKQRRSVAIGVGTPNAETQVRDLFNQYAPLAYLMPWEILDYVELLATYNPDYSQAVENVKMLANSGHNLFVEGGSRTASAVKKKIEEKARTIQERHGGIDGLIEKMLDQACTFGAMCGEWVTDEDLTDVIDFVDINPKYIRFFWEDDHWAPYQKVDARGLDEAKARGQKIRNANHIKLNELTFHYYAFDAAPGSPYGTPPFLAALTNIAIQRDMVTNMAQIVKKIGLLGIVDLTVKGLPMQPGESQEHYESRAGAFLDAYVTIIEDMVKDGGIVHFDDVEVDTTQVGGNAAGATNIFKQNEELIFSGLKSMPSVQGRSYSTTETYAGVAYEIILRNTAKYQRAVRRMIEGGYWLMVSLWGDNPDKIKVKFNNNRELNRLQAAQAEKAEIEVAVLKWALGLYNQEAVSQELNTGDIVQPYENVMDSPYAELQGKGGAAGAADPSAQPAATQAMLDDQQREIVTRILGDERFARIEELLLQLAA